MMRRLTSLGDLARRADELRRRAHHAHVDGDSRRSAVLNHAAAALETRLDAERQQRELRS